MERWFPIKTSRLLLREFTVADESAVHEFGGDPLVSQLTDWGPNTPDQTHELIEERIERQKVWPRDEVHLAMELVAERKVIGSITLWITDHANRTAGFGYALNRAFWNQGYATEAAIALVDRSFKSLNLHRVFATCDARNTGSWKVLEKLKMRKEGHFVRDKFQKGEWRDSYLYAVLAEEWIVVAGYVGKPSIP